MFASSLRCLVDGPGTTMQPTPFDAWVAARLSLRKFAWQTKHALLSATFFVLSGDGWLCGCVEPQGLVQVNLERRRLGWRRLHAALQDCRRACFSVF